MFLITGSYGEYDDYNCLPVMVVPDKDTVLMVIEELYNPNGQFKDLIADIFSYIPLEDLSFCWQEIKYFTLE